MNATQRSDGTFVDVQTDSSTTSFQRPSLPLYQAFHGAIARGQTTIGCYDLVLACACNVDSAKQLFEEWPGATLTVASALIEMVTPTVKQAKRTK